MFKRIFGAVVAALLISAPAAQNINPQDYFVLTTDFKGPTLAATVYEWGGGAYSTRLLPRPGPDEQYWRIVPVDASDPNGLVRLQPMFPTGNQCLGRVTVGKRNGMTSVLPCQNAAAQFWKLTPELSGFRIQNMFDRGESCLDVINGGPDDLKLTVKPCLKVSGQIWSLWPADKTGGGQDPAIGSLQDRCQKAVQGNVVWNIFLSPTDPKAKQWKKDDLERLCQSQAEPEVTVQCFTEILEESKSYVTAIDICSQLKGRRGG